MRYFWQSLKLFIWMTILLGCIYPLLITGIAYYSLFEKANGSLIQVKSQIMGSQLIAQKFEDNRYFWSRPSAVDYHPVPSGGSNLGPTSAKLKIIVEERRYKLLQAHPGQQAEQIPKDLLFASGSGLDPHISPEAAYFQVDRVAKARSMDSIEGRQAIRGLIDSLLEKRSLGFLGELRINVLRLNRALDDLKQVPSYD